MTMVISERQTGHSPSIADTRIAHASQKRACLHGTSAKPPRGATEQTSRATLLTVPCVIVLFDLVPLCQVSRCQVSRFQRPRQNT